MKRWADRLLVLRPLERHHEVMQYMVIGRDGTDPNAMLRRRAARDEHLAQVARMSQAGTLLCAAALLDEQGQMVGSMMLMSFPSRVELDSWLRLEPYMISGVWQDVSIQPVALAPAFAHLTNRNESSPTSTAS